LSIRVVVSLFDIVTKDMQ